MDTDCALLHFVVLGVNQIDHICEAAIHLLTVVLNALQGHLSHTVLIREHKLVIDFLDKIIIDLDYMYTLKQSQMSGLDYMHI